MKRIVLFVMTTLTILVLLFGYHTSTSSRAVAGESSVVVPVPAGASTATASTSAAPSSAGITKPSVPAGEAAGSDTTGGATVSVAPTTAPTTSAATSSSAAATTSSAAATTSSSAAVAGGTFLGDSTDTRWGAVQVQINVANGKITAVSVPVYPDGNGRDQEINATALPILVQETVSAQSSKIDMVSGATVTSDGYVTSLQSALDKAGL